ncbi:phosphonate C-P lyase system protein PhnG [Sporosarcina sp. NPDC096371]|uniref:phosphonate C-P lyase system protein PhnG n=1 Tax=Sporosarcina sp. NPDC096371 TaxID=3364530 RepID=UPI00382112C8
MNRRRRTKILIDGSRTLARQLANEIERNYPIHVVTEPHHGLTMIKLRETAKKTLFYLGEVLVTETKVQIHQSFGIGIVVGNEEELSYQLAVIDAAYEADLIDTQSWAPLLIEEEKRIQQHKTKQEASLLKTKVNFEMMDV